MEGFITVTKQWECYGWRRCKSTYDRNGGEEEGGEMRGGCGVSCPFSGSIGGDHRREITVGEQEECSVFPKVTIGDIIQNSDIIVLGK